MQKKQLDEFAKGILGIARLNNVMVKSGFGADEETLFKLKSETVKFCELYTKVDASKADIESLAGNVEGLLLQCQTLGVLTKKQAETYIDKLHGLVKGK